jgi:hypothetical protein
MLISQLSLNIIVAELLNHARDEYLRFRIQKIVNTFRRANILN